MHHKRQPSNRTLATLDKRSRALVLFNPHFFFFLFFYQKEYHQASFGDRPSRETSRLFHINVGIIVMLVTSFPCGCGFLVSSMCLRQVFLGRLRD